MALCTASSCNPLSVSLGHRLEGKVSSTEVRNLRLESSLKSASPSPSEARFGAVSRRQLTWKSGPQGLLPARRGIRRLIVSAAEDGRNENESSRDGSAPSREIDVDAFGSRLGLGRRARRQQQSGIERPESKSGASTGSSSKGKNTPGKSWDNMSLPEKAWALYIDPNKGILFWLNKLAYGAIFVIIGSWVVFRFIGPALGWYQLDQPLLAPDRLFDSAP